MNGHFFSSNNPDNSSLSAATHTKSHQIIVISIGMYVYFKPNQHNEIYAYVIILIFLDIIFLKGLLFMNEYSLYLFIYAFGKQVI